MGVPEKIGMFIWKQGYIFESEFGKRKNCHKLIQNGDMAEKVPGFLNFCLEMPDNMKRN